MNESDNPTKIRPSTVKADKGNDRTRVPNDNKTRIKPTGAQSQSRSGSGSDATQFRKPNQRANPRSREQHTDASSQFAYTKNATAGGHHGVLKERFILAKVIGSGGMGVVYKAKDLLKVEAKDRDPYVAIKVLSEEFKSHPEAFISLQRESRKSQRIAQDRKSVV